MHTFKNRATPASARRGRWCAADSCRCSADKKLPESAKGSGRLQLADWLTQSDNPLTARVMANRIWHYHFGRGIVPTPSDFGVRGTAPTHPALLDRLADNS